MFFGMRAAVLALHAVSRRFVHPSTERQVDISKVEVPIARLAPEFDGCRIVQFSDTHVDGVTTTRAQLAALITLINGQQPDVVAFTGDFVSYGDPFDPADLVEPLHDLHARDTVVAVMGNHDQNDNAETIRRVIHESRMIDLNNAIHTLRRGGACLHLAGVDSLWMERARLDKVLEALPAGDPAILLAHEPEFIDVSAPTKRFALQLSGHTHGGQIRLPLLTALALGRNRRYRSGLYQVNGTALYVNRGYGMVGLPFRINCPPELTMITLRSA